MLTVHGRTRVQMYAPPVDFDTIKNVKKAVKIPVVANGDIVDGNSALNMLEITECDYLMVGRAAQGNPFIFSEINAFLKGENYTPPTLLKRFEVLREQVGLMMKYKDPHNAILESRKHTAWYMYGLRGAANLRKMCATITTMDDVINIAKAAMAENPDL